MKKKSNTLTYLLFAVIGVMVYLNRKMLYYVNNKNSVDYKIKTETTDYAIETLKNESKNQWGDLVDVFTGKKGFFGK